MISLKIIEMYTSTEKRDSWLLKSGLLVGITSFFLLMAGAASAQEDRIASFGVKGGANWSNLWVKDVHDNNARIGFHAGLQSEIQLFPSCRL